MNSPVAPAAYAFPPRALQRWARENLTLTPRADGGCEATFALEGSTCGNIAFHLRYRVTLGPAADGHRLLELACEPAPHDTNHREQCSAKADYARFAALLAAEAPLLGQPLAEALAWNPATTLDGCLCAQTARAHKWRAVLQTVHFALHSAL